MPKGFHRGMRTSKSSFKIKGRHRTPKAKHAWSSSRKFGTNRYYLETVQPKKPTKKELNSIRQSRNNPRLARVVKQDKAKEGHKIIVRSQQTVGKYGIYTKPKPKTTRKKPVKKTKKTTRRKK